MALDLATLELPPLPRGHALALEMLFDDGVELRDVADVLDSDPALTAAVLRSANSARSSPLRRIAEAHEAVVRLGLFESRRVVAGVVLGQTFALRQLRRSRLDAEQMWRHVVACGLLSEIAMEQWDRRSLAFTGGLLHDIGRLAMAAQDPRSYARAVQLMRVGYDAREAEQRVFGVDHESWGVEVAEHFSLPPEIVQAIGDHHEGARTELGRAIRDARIASRKLGIGDGVTASSEPDVDESAEEWGRVHSMGGFEVLNRRINWYSEAIHGAGGIE